MGRRAIALTKLMFKFNVDIPKDPIVNIQTTENRGFTPDEVAERCVEKLISVSDTTRLLRVKSPEPAIDVASYNLLPDELNSLWFIANALLVIL